MELSKVTESSNGAKAVAILEILILTKLADLENIHGTMAASTKENGVTIRCMDAGFFYGPMDESILDNITGTRNMVTVHLSGLVGQNI